MSSDGAMSHKGACSMIRIDSKQKARILDHVRTRADPSPIMFVAGDMKRIDATTCPDCKQWTRMIGFFTSWCGWDSTCLKCGRRWSDGEWMPLDFVRGSRQKSIDAAKARWRRASEN